MYMNTYMYTHTLTSMRAPIFDTLYLYIYTHTQTLSIDSQMPDDAYTCVYIHI